jgi:hypothetical protein
MRETQIKQEIRFKIHVSQYEDTNSLQKYMWRWKCCIMSVITVEIEKEESGTEIIFSAVTTLEG